MPFTFMMRNRIVSTMTSMINIILIVDFMAQRSYMVALDCTGAANKVNTECPSITIQWIAVCYKYSGSPKDELNRPRHRLTFHCVTPAGRMIQ